MRRNVVFRGWAVLWAVLQFALPVGATLADAELAGASVEAPASHVESSTSDACAPSHPDECALCQFLSRAAPPASAVALPTIVGALEPSTPSLVQSAAMRALARASLPRAPPLALS
jgi:hypothetical protein